MVDRTQKFRVLTNLLSFSCKKIVENECLADVWSQKQTNLDLISLKSN